MSQISFVAAAICCCYLLLVCPTESSFSRCGEELLEKRRKHTAVQMYSRKFLLLRICYFKGKKKTRSCIISRRALHILLLAENLLYIFICVCVLKLTFSVSFKFLEVKQGPFVTSQMLSFNTHPLEVGTLTQD